MVRFSWKIKSHLKYIINRFLSYYFVDVTFKDRMCLFINYINHEIFRVRKNVNVEMKDFAGNIFVNVINLPFRKDRRERINAIMNLNETEFEFFEGTYGNTLSDRDLNYVTNRSRYNLSKGSIGCSISHIKLWEYIAQQSSNDIFIILEDDVILYPGFKNTIYKLTKNLPVDYDIIFLGSNSTRGRDVSYYVNANLFKSFNPRRGLYAYLVNPRSSKKLVKLIKPFDLLYGGIDTKIGKLVRNAVIIAYHFSPSIVGVDTLNTSNIYNFSLRNKKRLMFEFEKE